MAPGCERAEVISDGTQDSSGTEVVLDSTALFGDRRLLEIRHRAETYTLRITRNDKLILTK